MTRRASAFGGHSLARTISDIEAMSGGRLGVCVVDTASNARFGHRANERFALCSTFKFLLAAAVLARVDRNQESLDRMVTVRSADLVSHSPIAATYADKRPARVAALLEAMMIQSDNAAANLMLPAVGGPAGLTRWLRQTGDRVTQLDRTEPTLNAAVAGDPRDTTSPAAMADTMARILFGQVLSASSRTLLIDWLIDNRTGDARLRAGMRPGWRIGDKTGSGENGTTNDIALVWPGPRAPILIACYLTGSPLGGDDRNAVIARVGRALTTAMTPRR